MNRVIRRNSVIGSLTRIMLFEDLYYPDNRLPNGEICSIYTKEGDPKRGHYLFGSPYCVSLFDNLKGDETIAGVTYGHVNGPRFNSKKEIKALQGHCDAISQTCGPETVLAGELEMPFVLLGFGVDYANGVKDEPTPISVLEENMEKSKPAFTQMIQKIIDNSSEATYSGFVYRFEQ